MARLNSLYHNLRHVTALGQNYDLLVDVDIEDHPIFYFDYFHPPADFLLGFVWTFSYKWS